MNKNDFSFAFKANTPEEAAAVMARVQRGINDALKPPRFRFLHMLCFVAAGIAMGSLGGTVSTWEFWTVIGALSGASLCGQYGRWH